MPRQAAATGIGASGREAAAGAATAPQRAGQRRHARVLPQHQQLPRARGAPRVGAGSGSGSGRPSPAP